jgi:hypothetical protein
MFFPTLADCFLSLVHRHVRLIGCAFNLPPQNHYQYNSALADGALNAQ